MLPPLGDVPEFRFCSCPLVVRSGVNSGVNAGVASQRSEGKHSHSASVCFWFRVPLRPRRLARSIFAFGQPAVVRRSCRIPRGKSCPTPFQFAHGEGQVGVVGGSVQEEIEGWLGGGAGPVGLEAVGAPGFGVTMQASGAGCERGGGLPGTGMDGEDALFHVSVVGGEHPVSGPADSASKQMSGRVFGC